MPGSNDKQIIAINFNQKEQRCLEKSMQTLNLEKSYQLKLLDLNHRVLRVGHRKLKDRVNRIKSHLTVDQIVELRQLENDGKLRENSNTFNLNSTLKIAAAERRLKLNSERVRPKTANPRMEQGLRDSTSDISKSDDSLYSKRRNSVSEICERRPHIIASRKFAAKERATSAYVNGRSQSGAQSVPPEHARPRPMTSVAPSRRKLSAVNEHKSTNGCQATGRLPYSSHSLLDREDTLGTFPDRRQSAMSNHSIDDNLGGNLYEERRQELIHNQSEVSRSLEEKKNTFVRKIDDYMKSNPLDEFMFDDDEIMEIFQEEKDGDDVGAPQALQRRLRAKQGQRTIAYAAMSEEERNQSLWKDIKKCRYIRAPDDVLDLTGVVTLVKDQMKMLKSLNFSKGESFLASVKV